MKHKNSVDDRIKFTQTTSKRENDKKISSNCCFCCFSFILVKFKDVQKLVSHLFRLKLNGINH